MANKKVEIKEIDIFEEFSDLIEKKEVKSPKYVDPANVKYEGVIKKIEGKDYVIPSLSTGQYKRLAEKLSNFLDWSQMQQFNFMILLTFLAFSRNYEEVEKEWIEENISISEIKEIMDFVMSGLTKEEVSKINEEKKS